MEESVTTVYKFTDQKMQTRGGYQWIPGQKRTTSGTGPICSSGWLHAYEDLTVGIMMQPIHGNIPDPLVFRAEGIIGIRDGEFKCGCSELTLIESVEIPTVTMEHRVRFAILCAYPTGSHTWRQWAKAWLSGADRSQEAAARAAWAAEARAEARAAEAARAEATAAAEAARAARAAAWAAAWAAEAAIPISAIAALAISGPRFNPFGRSL
jgi:hypothetical protein